MTKILIDALAQLAVLSPTMPVAVCLYNLLVNYPGLKNLEGEAFTSFHNKLNRSLYSFMLPLMIMEMLSFLLIIRFKGVRVPSDWLFSVVCLFVLWSTTFLILPKIHSKMILGKNKALLQKLIFVDWLRIIFWTAKTVSFYYYIG